MMRLILITMILSFGGAQVFAAPCNMHCEKSNFTLIKANNSQVTDHCHKKETKQNKSENSNNKKSCPLTACIVSATNFALSDNLQFTNQAKLIYVLVSYNLAHVLKLNNTIIPNTFLEYITISKVPLYLKHKNLKLPS